MLALVEEQRALVDLVRTFAERELAPHALEWDRSCVFPIEVLREAGALGLGGIVVGEEFGGSALSRPDAALVFENLARGDTTIAAYISIHNMVTGMLDRHGTREQRARWLPAMVSMDVLGSYCLTEPGSGSDAAALRTSATRDGDHYVINGAKQFISGAGAAGVYIVMARTGEPGPKGISAIVVEAGTAGMSFGQLEHKMGWNAQPTRAVTFEDVRVPVAQRLGDEGGGFEIAMRALDGGRLSIAACSLGGAQWAYEQAVHHLAARSAFGGRLIDNAAVQFQLADMATNLEASRVLLASASAALERGDADAVRQCAMAKRFVTDACFDVANAALQLHGGYGYLADYGVEKVVRDLRVHQILEGANDIMRMIVGRQIAAGIV
ncbi:acyl-CoA dehydrogenase family protein [Leifsonia sp. H3M29-4]|uniref:acyl-CoA dehydrogenase family protein n=1 Tax=Salinibacterium metalliresistens TaxID=3031321 RepID=UPI0023DBD5E4|nr:acyl-CoA dehydrogenase family protein [Salinibacterium metalliresistens]MDF1479324.1 acyl-CoA dehydrogenase family protein [Salinibacterium metalliresistens]